MHFLAPLLLAVSFLAQSNDYPRATPIDIAAGAKTFRSHCAPCHGLEAEGGRGPNLAAGHFYHGGSDTALFAHISEGIPGTEMPGSFYSADRLWQIIAYLRSLNASGAQPSGHVEPGSLTRGAALFSSQGCKSCHRIQGQGGGLAPDLSQIGAVRSRDNLRQSLLDPDLEVSPRYWLATFQTADDTKISGFLLNEDTYTVQIMDTNEQLRSYDKSSLRRYTVSKRSVMPSFKSLSAEQIADLVGYLSSLRPTE